jgi:glycosyltransferase involved in cell wall biosynthesis
MPHIVMLLSNPYRPDPRVQTEANILASAGYTITMICWDRLAELPEEETVLNGVHILRVQSIRSKYGAGLRQVVYTPRFWSAAIQKALPLNPDIVYCRDLDTLYAGVRIKKYLGCKLLFDAHEDYPSLMSLYLPAFFVRLLVLFQSRLLRQVDGAVAASSVTASKLAGSGVSPTIYFPNVHDLTPFEKITQEQVDLIRQELSITPTTHLVSYIGGFTRNRMILPLIEAVRSLPDTFLVLAGEGHQRSAIEEAIQGQLNIHYFGWLSSEKVPLYIRSSDTIYYCLKPDYPGAIYNNPNTLFYAMAAGRPIIANDIGDLGSIVRETGCGILLDEVNPQTIRAAILKLADPNLRARLGQAGCLAAEHEYNWSIAERRLLDLYRSLLSNSGS